MLKVDISSNIDAIAKKLVNQYPEHVRFATSKAINSTLDRTKKVLDRKLITQLKSPTPFTKKALYVWYSNKRTLKGEIGVKRIQAEYLKYQIKGGTRLPKGRKEAVPAEIRLNKYGNIPGRHAGAIRKLLEKPGVFQATIKGVSGIWQRGNRTRAGRFSVARRRRGNDIRLLVYYAPYVQYDKKPFTFYETGEKTIRRYLIREFNQAIRRAAKPGIKYQV